MPVQKGRAETESQVKSFWEECLFEREAGTTGSRRGNLVWFGLLFSQWVLRCKVGWELSLEDISHGISASSLYYELDYQIKYLGYTGYNDIFMEGDITDGFSSRFNSHSTVQWSYGTICQDRELSHTYILYGFVKCVNYKYFYLTKAKLLNIYRWSYF